MATISTTNPSLTLVKSFTYRGGPEQWSNTYFMDGAIPASSASWHTLAAAVAAAEKTLYDVNTTIVKYIGHAAGSSIAVWSEDLVAESATIAGTYSETGAFRCGGDTAAWIRWKTAAITSKGKPIYLRSYYHPAYVQSTGASDPIASSWTALAATFGAAWVTGFADGGSVTHHRAGPHGAVGSNPVPSTYATTRTLERRGRRP
jgi:hypothetical protein